MIGWKNNLHLNIVKLGRRAKVLYNFIGYANKV